VVDQALALNPVQRVDIKAMLARTPNHRKLAVFCAFVGLTYADIARRAGIAPKLLSDYWAQKPGARRNKKSPPYALLAKLAAYATLEVGDLWDVF